MTSDPLLSPKAIEAGLRAYDQASRRRKWPHGYGHERPDEPVCEWDRRRLEAAFDAALKAQPVVALSSCPMCEGTGVKDAEIEPDAACPCPSCKGSGLDRLIPESEIREWIAALPLGHHVDHEDGSSSYAPLGASGAMDRLRTWLDEREARQ